MPISFFDASVGSYLQILDSVAAVLEKGAAHAEAGHLDLEKAVETRLRDDMFPFRFQIRSVAHHSLGALQGMQAGEFGPPSSEPDRDYAGLRDLIAEARSGVAALSQPEVEALAEGSLKFKIAQMELPFSNVNFLLSFSLPNFYFHATTAYDILRMLGVPLGKRDFMGAMKVG